MKDAVARDAIKIKAPFAELQEAVRNDRLIGKDVDLTSLQRYGVRVVKQHFSKALIAEMAQHFHTLLASGDIKRSAAHRTEVRFRDDQPFAKIIENQEFLSLARPLFDGEIALDFMRIVKKDTVDRDPVFLHQDAGYQVGRYDAYSIFIALTNCGPDNGGLAFYPGSLNYGHLGDVGGIAPILPPEYPLLHPALEAGDAVIMHAGTWHFSTPNRTGDDRVYLEVNIRSADDPGAKQLLGCEEKREWILNISVSDLFESSREQRMKALYQEIARLKQELAEIKDAPQDATH
ncbi:phytanoyl-CoA dioxygenase family protein [Herbaspirillum sp. LeCh32-8]|uniref:phytanoyl-CoA dioxygenase family protein n=1 Tax=Herbaspirillum sp. LeCh32-8 TaxID=2821356 RepID=UPI001AE55408|nr:phytanoyl-CoA dioxygenase family protein [Herbaspirillum sp. LeCh32-8]MBP0600704.1 phytanoyl-CoA dioxygenase family protein [Herbaspirillum sp. LeCh32-8]